jgi:hypothetical protein
MPGSRDIGIDEDANTFRVGYSKNLRMKGNCHENEDEAGTIDGTPTIDLEKGRERGLLVGARVCDTFRGVKARSLGLLTSSDPMIA